MCVDNSPLYAHITAHVGRSGCPESHPMRRRSQCCDSCPRSAGPLQNWRPQNFQSPTSATFFGNMHHPIQLLISDLGLAIPKPIPKTGKKSYAYKT